MQHEYEKCDVDKTVVIVTEEEVMQKKNELEQISKNHKTAKVLMKNLDKKIEDLDNELENINNEIEERMKERDNYFADFENSVEKVKWYNEKYNDLLGQKINVLNEQKEQKVV